MISHFSVPDFKVVIRDLSSSVENHDASMSTVIVARVELVKRLLARRIPDV